jgi:hypothetical protein
MSPRRVVDGLVVREPKISWAVGREYFSLQRYDAPVDPLVHFWMGMQFPYPTSRNAGLLATKSLSCSTHMYCGRFVEDHDYDFL